MQAAPIALAGYFLLVAVVAVIAGVLQMSDDSSEFSGAVLVLVGIDWLASGVVFAVSGALLALRRARVDRRAVLILAAVCIVDAMLLTFAPLFGAPIAAVASLAAILRVT